MDKEFQQKMEAFMAEMLEFRTTSAEFQKRVDDFIDVSEKRHAAVLTQLQSIRTRLDGTTDSLNDTKDDVVALQKRM